MTASGRLSAARRLLVLSERLPRPDESSGSARFLALLGFAARRFAVDLWVERDETGGWVPLAPERVAADRARLASVGVRVLANGWRPLAAALRDAAYDAVLLEFHDVAARYLPLVRDRLPGARMVIDSVDLHFARLEAGARIGAVDRGEAERVRRTELDAYRAADAVIATSAEDAEELAAAALPGRVHCVPNVAPIRARAAGPRSREVLFVGHFHHAPNVDGVRWLVHEIWPAVRARDAHARLTIAGSRAPAEVLSLSASSGVRVLGYVPEVASHLDRVAAVAAPLRYGAGMKGKVVEALAAGVPVVTTTIGAQGLGLEPGRHALLADDAAGFAAALGELLDDPERGARIGLAGQAHVAGICAPERVAAALDAALDDALGSPPAGDGRRRGSAGLGIRMALRHALVSAARRQVGRLAASRVERS